MKFEVFDQLARARSSAPTATLQKGGILSLNGAAHDLLGRAESFELLFSREERVIALRPSTEAHAYAFRIANENTGQGVISLGRFAAHFGIDVTESQRLTPEMQDDMMLLRLKKDKPSDQVSDSHE